MNINNEDRDMLIDSLDYARNEVFRLLTQYQQKAAMLDADMCTLSNCEDCSSGKNRVLYATVDRYTKKYESIRAMLKRLRADRDVSKSVEIYEEHKSHMSPQEIWDAIQSGDAQELLKVLP